ncbi:MAG: carbon-nitrogen hydrolase family protein, partial [Archaeoglobales archaeon]
MDGGLYHPVRCKYYLPECETKWFGRGNKEFQAVKIRNALVGI